MPILLLGLGLWRKQEVTFHGVLLTNLEQKKNILLNIEFPKLSIAINADDQLCN